MKKIFLIIAVLITITACSKDNNPNAVNLTESSEQTSSANKSTTRETKNVGETKIRNQTLNLAESLGCSENTAQSLCDQLEEITQKSIADIEMLLLMMVQNTMQNCQKGILLLLFMQIP